MIRFKFADLFAAAAPQIGAITLANVSDAAQGLGAIAGLFYLLWKWRKELNAPAAPFPPTPPPSGPTAGFAPVVVVVAIAAALGLAWVAKPSLFPGASHRAAVSTSTTAALVSAETKKDAFAAASVVKIQEANAAAPESPAKAFISQESALTLTNLPTPDATALLEAERRRAAVMSGQLDEARRLYETAAANSEKLTRERDAALAERQAADVSLTVAAAAEHASAVQKLALGLVALLALGLWLYAKIYGITPATLGNVVADIRAGANPIQAFDTNLAPWMQARVALAARIAAPPPPDVRAGNP